MSGIAGGGHDKAFVLVVGLALGVLADVIAILGTFTRTGPWTLLIALIVVAVGFVIVFLGEWLRRLLSRQRNVHPFHRAFFLAVTALIVVVVTALAIFFVTNTSPRVAGPGEQSTHAGAAVDIEVRADDPDGNTLTYTATGLPEGLSIHQDTGRITGKPTVVGRRPVTITVADRWGGSSKTRFTWSVVNKNPEVEIGAQTTHAGNQVKLQVPASDPDSDKLTYTERGLPEGLSLNRDTGLITGAPTVAGDASVTITVTDLWGGSGEARFSWSVTNQDPAVELIGQITYPDAPVDLQVRGSDPDNDAVAYSATGLPDGLSINKDTGRITGKPTAGGTWDVAVTVTDSWGGSGVARLIWSVPQVGILYPSPNERAGDTVEASGTAKGIPAGRKVWLVVKVGNGYWPQSQSLQLSGLDAGKWSQTVFFGGPGDAGRSFALYAVLADQAADQQFNNWMSNGIATGKYPAMTRDYPNPPILAQVTVIRQ